MFAKKNKGAATAGQIDSLIGRGTRIEGHVVFSGGLRVDGEIVGRVLAEPGAPSTLVLSEHGRIEGEVRVGHLIVNGCIDGPVTVSEFLEMQPKARINGDVSYAMIEIQQGAVVEGRLLLHPQAAPEPSPEKTD
ncbi:MAG: polymer-forming cytoskeletal protein [Azovibrio sp.]|nr:polymer-forming cytoskeletal protein [Azovibrio sp.]